MFFAQNCNFLLSDGNAEQTLLLRNISSRMLSASDTSVPLSSSSRRSSQTMRSNAFLLPYVVLSIPTLSLCDFSACRSCSSEDATIPSVKRSDRNVPPIGFGIPTENGGSMLTVRPLNCHKSNSAFMLQMLRKFQ